MPLSILRRKARKHGSQADLEGRPKKVEDALNLGGGAPGPVNQTEFCCQVVRVWALFGELL
jgi:hypothetical protein